MSRNKTSQKESESDEEERMLTRLKKLWKSLLSKNERALFVEKKLCRSKVIAFLGSHLCHPNVAARYLALDLLCGSVPRLGDKTDALLRPLVPTLLKMMEKDTPKDIVMKAYHFMRAYSRATQNIESFLFDFCRMGLDSTSEEIQLSCIHGMCIIFDQDIGDKLYSILLPSLAGLLNRNSFPKVLRSTYRSLKRIHDIIEDDRFFKLMDPDTTDFYMGFLTFDENDPYLNSDLLDLQKLITEYKDKMTKIHLKRAFGIIELAFLTHLGVTGDCQKEFSVNNLALAIKRIPWSESEVESHVLDLIKLVAAFLADDSDRLSQMSGLDILNELVSRMRFHIGQHLTNVVEILRETMASSSVELASKTKKVVHRLMRVVHPMSVIWEMLRDCEPRHKESILGFICGELRRFPYCDFDLVSLCATVGQDLEDSNPRVRQGSRKCVALLLNVMQTSPVPVTRRHAILNLLRDQSLKKETLKSVGISEVECGEFRGDSFSCLEESATSSTAPSTAMSSVSTLVSEMSAIHSHSIHKRQFEKNAISNDTQLRIKQFSKFTSKLADRHSISSSSDTQNNTLSQNMEEIVPSTAPSSSNDLSNSKPDSYMKLLDREMAHNVGNSKDTSISRESFEQIEHMLNEGNIIHSNILHTEKKVSPSVKFRSRICKSYRFYPKTPNTPVNVPNFRKTVKDDVKHSKSILVENIGDSSLISNLENGEPISICSILYSDQISLKQDNSTVMLGDCSSIGHPNDTSTPRFRTKLSKECNFEPLERKFSFSGGDNFHVPKTNQSCLIQCGNRCISESECSRNDVKCDVVKSDIHEEHLADGNCTLVSISSVSTDRAMDEQSDVSLGIQVQCLDPKKYNFNILRVSTPKTTESIQELDEDESIDDESITEASPVIVTTPGESDGFSDSRNNLRQKISRSCSQIKNLPQTKRKFIKSAHKEHLNDTEMQIKLKSSDDNIKYARSNIPKRKAWNSNTRNSNQHSDKRKSQVYTQDASLKSFETRVKGKPKSMNSPTSEKYSFNPAYYKLTKEDAYYKLTNPSTEAEIPGVISNEKTESADDQSEEGMEDSSSVCTIVDTSIRTEGDVQGIPSYNEEDVHRYKGRTTDTVNNKTDSVETFNRHSNDNGENSRISTQIQSVSNGMSSTSVDTPPWCKGRDIPRTPVTLQEGDRFEKGLKTFKYVNRSQEDESKKIVVPIKKPNNGEKKAKKTCLSIDGEEDARHSESPPKDDVELEDLPPNSLLDGLFDKCPWRRDLEFAHKGGTCPWAISFEECFRQMAPLSSEEAAEAEIKKALEHLNENSWECKEAGLAGVLRVAVHHQEVVASGEVARVVVAVCREVRNFRKSVAGKAVITLGLLFGTMGGRRMENKLRVVVSALVTKSGNRTLAAYFRLVIESLFRIVSSSPPQKVALAFINEGSRHPNKASRETASQFLCVLTESMGSGNSLSGAMASPMLRCAARFVFDCSPLTRYCGKRMFQVFQKHPQFQKMKNHHLDVSTVSNLSKVLEHIGSKGVVEECLPINIIKEKMKECLPNQENTF